MSTRPIFHDLHAGVHRTTCGPLHCLRMAGLRSAGFLAVLPAAAAATASALAASPQHARHPPSAANRGPFVRACREAIWGYRSACSSASSSLGRLRGASLLALLAAAGGNSAMAVSEEQSETTSSATSMNGATMPDLMTEFMVKMSCEGCVKSVRNKLEPLEGVHSVDVDLANQVVRIVGSASTKNLTSAIEQTGRDARLIGQGLSSEFTASAAVAEFKGPEIHGVVRFAQVAMGLARIDASFNGLTPGSHAWSINTYGDLTRGAASTGNILESQSSNNPGSKNEALGDLGILDVNGSGDADFSGTKVSLQVSDLVGRSVVVYENDDKSQPGITAAVIARSAGVGQNYKTICSCDGTVIWESTNSDFVRA